MSSRSKPVLILGMSHVQAIHRAMSDYENEQIEVIDINAKPTLFDQKNNKINYDLLRGHSPEFVFLSIRGNYHNVFGLIENPVPLSIGDAHAGIIPGDPQARTRHFVPESMMRAYFSKTLADLSFLHLDPLVSHFAPARMFHLSSPFPCGDSEHINAHPGVFRPRLHLGVSPPSLRRKFFDIHTDLYRNACKSAGIRFVEAPQQASREDGLMKREYWSNDQTHGNSAYGRLVLNQIRELTGALQ